MAGAERRSVPGELRGKRPCTPGRLLTATGHTTLGRMKLALLGADPESLALAEAAVAAGHEITWQGDLGAAIRNELAWMAGEDRGDQWEDLLDPSCADAIFVGRGAASQDLRARQVQELTKLGRPLLVVHPLFESVLTYFEIDLTRGESGGVLEHFNPLAESPAAAALAQWVTQGHPMLGAVEQVVATRTLANRRRATVLWHFARDVELLDRIAGPLDQLGRTPPAAHASAPPRTPTRVTRRSASNYRARDRSRCAGRSSRRPRGASCDSLSCARGAGSTRHSPTMPVAWNWSCSKPAALRRPSTWARDNAAAGAVEQFVADVKAGGAATTWPAALRSMELVDTIEIALRRGRMIDVHRQQLTEELAFKGTMAAAGCAVLGAIVPAMLVVGWIAGEFGVPVARFLPHALLVFLAGFLALQLLPRLLTAKRADNEDSS